MCESHSITDIDPFCANDLDIVIPSILRNSWIRASRTPSPVAGGLLPNVIEEEKAALVEPPHILTTVSRPWDDNYTNPYIRLWVVV